MGGVLSIADIMKDYGVSKKTATRWAKAVGTLPRVKGGKIYVSATALRSYLQGDRQ